MEEWIYNKYTNYCSYIFLSTGNDDAEIHIDAGSINYKIEAFYMKNLNGDEKFEILKNKIKNNKKLPITTIDVIATDIFELESVEDLEKYF